MEFWKFGDYKNYTSLQLLCHVLNIPSPKDNLDGSMVSDAYWHKEDLDSIVVYCQKDVVTVIQIMMKVAGLPIFSQDKIEYINQRQE